jgi:hypothetical protein
MLGTYSRTFFSSNYRAVAEEAESGKIQGSCGGVPVNFVGRKQLIANKRSTGRKKDIADLELLGEKPS